MQHLGYTDLLHYGNCVIYNSKFYKNRSSAWAGGITTYRNGNTTIYDSEFKGNLAGWNGGALYCYNILNVYNTVFEDNNCTTNNGGGAIGACQFEGIPVSKRAVPVYRATEEAAPP